MAAVAVPLHHALLDLRANSRLICGLPPEECMDDVSVAGPTGRGLRLLPKELLSGLVHIHGLWTPFEWRAQRRARENRALLVISPHGALAPWALAHKRFKKLVAWALYQRRIVQRADLLIANSELEHDQLRQLGLRPPVAVIPNGVDVRRLPLTEVVGAKRGKIVLFLARLSPTKGISDLLEAWRGLEDRKGYELHIHGFGDASYRGSLERHIQECGLVGCVKLLGPLYREEKWEKFCSSSIYALPSYGESFALTIVEALSAGLPVVTTNATPWSHLAEMGLGWVVENDVGQLRQALREALSLTPCQLKSIEKQAKRYAGNFSWSKIADRYLGTYHWLCDRGMPTPDWISV
ncbi:glycosyltransferase [Bradyrhizobium nitroreducens]|uniref:glycosyltransferase n=1 Tax=Bradyrhizobium nitroreducens TaxID=709803 RepID=UPI0011AE324A|nr:glycosyltransferase [Bradyrhizobium nitroreducens]